MKTKAITAIMITVFLASIAAVVTPVSANEGNRYARRFLFGDTYEDNPTITIATSETFSQIMSDIFIRDYWADQEHWLELGKTEEARKYEFDLTLGEAKVTDEIAYKGTRSAEVTFFGCASDFEEAGCWLARYFHDPSLVKHGVYEVGAWFYVPKGNTPTVVLSMENRLFSWVMFYIINVGLITEDGSVVARCDDGDIRIGRINFQHDMWFKLWIIYNTHERKYIVGYKSSIEQKTFKVNKIWTCYLTLRALYFYAGIATTDNKKQELYVDNFYAKVVKS